MWSDIQVITRGLTYDRLHPEVAGLFPETNTLEDWLFMRDPEGASAVTK